MRFSEFYPQRILCFTGSNQQQIGNISFTGEAETEAIKLAAFDILKQLNNEGHISSNELRFIAEKRKIET